MKQVLLKRGRRQPKRLLRTTRVVLATFCGIEFAISLREIRPESRGWARIKGTRKPDDNWLAKIAKKRKTKQLENHTGALVRKSDVDITEEQAHWIKYRTWSYKKKKKI